MVQHGINDFWEPINGGGEWTLSRHINHHMAQTDLLARQAGQVDVVITHWPPTKEAIHPKFDGDELKPLFHQRPRGPGAGDRREAVDLRAHARGVRLPDRRDALHWQPDRLQRRAPDVRAVPAGQGGRGRAMSGWPIKSAHVGVSVLRAGPTAALPQLPSTTPEAER